MKKHFPLFLLFLLAFTSLYAQAENSNEKKEVNQAITKFFDGIAALDVKQMKHYVTNDFLLLEGGDVWNMDSLVFYLDPLKTKSYNRTNHFDFIRTEIKGKTAWIAYNNVADVTINGQRRTVRWLESAVLVKEGKEWKIQLLHSTPLKPSTN